MEKYCIANAHAHIFPEKIAAKAVRSIGDFYDLHMGSSGLADALLADGSAIGTEVYLVCSTATTPAQVESINNFIIREVALHPEFMGFATMHPGYPDIEAEIARAAAAGLRGVKLHPDFQRFNIDDPAALPIYRACCENGLAVLFHAGDPRYDYSAPAQLASVARRFPELLCMAAHFGGYGRWDDVGVYEGLENVVFDTSSALFSLPPARARELIGRFGPEKFLFGTDFPMWESEPELQRFLALQLDEKTQKLILRENFRRIFGR